MKVVEILNEAPRDEKILQNVAKEILKVIRKEVQAEEKRLDALGDDDDYDVSGEIELGRLGNALKKHDISTKVFGPLSNRLRQTKLNIITSGTLAGDKGGLYYPGHNELAVHYPLWNNKLKPQDRVYEKDVVTAIVHELRHRLDDSLSRGWAFGDTPTATETDKEHRLGSKLPYYREKTEINARLSEVKQLLSNWLGSQMKQGGVPAPIDVVEKINELMRTKNLVDIFDTRDDAILARRDLAKDTQEQIAATDNKQYKRLMARIIKYYNDEVEQIQNERN